MFTKDSIYDRIPSKERKESTMSRRKGCFSLGAAVLTVSLAGVSSMASAVRLLSTAELCFQWGQTLKTIEISRENGEDKVFLEGTDCEIMESDVQCLEEFYLLSGSSDEEAYDLAVEECKEEAALYAEAQRRGFYVSEEDAEYYVENELRPMLEISEDSSNLEEVISGYGSREEYWELQYEIYEKKLPIQQLEEELQAEFGDLSSEDGQGAFESYYEEYKEHLVQETF